MYIYAPSKTQATPNISGVMVNPPVVLSFNFLLTNHMPVWVVNNTRPKGKVVLQMTLPTGKTKPVFIDRSLLPVCITDEVGPEMVENGSHDLRAYINKGILQLVWPHDALQMVGTPEAQMELQRLRASEFSANSTFVSQRIQDMERTTPMQSTDLQAGAVIGNELNPRVLDFVARVTSNDVPVKDAVGELKIMEDELTDKDLSYIIAQVATGKAKKYAQTLLAQRQGTSAPDTKATKPASGDYDITKDDGSDLTPEEKAEDAKRAAAAKAYQRL